MNQRHRSCTGFTLLELLVALVIFVLALGSITGLLVSSLRASELNERVSERVQDVEAAVRVIRADVELAGFRGVDESLIDDESRTFGGNATLEVTLPVSGPHSLTVRYFEDRLFGADDRCGGVCVVTFEIREVDGTRVLFRVEGDGSDDDQDDQEGILRDMNSLRILGFLNRTGGNVPMESGSYAGIISAINVELVLSDDSEWVFPIAVPNAQTVVVNRPPGTGD